MSKKNKKESAVSPKVLTSLGEAGNSRGEPMDLVEADDHILSEAAKERLEKTEFDMTIGESQPNEEDDWRAKEVLKGTHIYRFKK